ncbi:MAG: hypothetical protein RL199_1341 [Pseudomonadota bacterium]|jgi:hypothetical protein
MRLATLPLLAFLLTAPAARATVVVERPVEELTRRATVVVHGIVTGSKTTWEEAEMLPATRTTLKVVTALKGDAGDAVVVRQSAGRAKGVALAIPGDARFAVGEEVVVFLERHPSEPGSWVLTSMAAAKFQVRHDAKGDLAVRDLGGLSFAKRDRDGRVRVDEKVRPSATIPLPDLLSRITAARR